VLSPYFAVKVASNRQATFYHFRDPQDPNSRETLGQQYIYWGSEFLRVERFGSRSNTYAISSDGQALLYFTEPIAWFTGPGQDVEPSPYGAKLHLFRHGRGDSLIVSDVDHWAGLPDDRPVPDDAVVYRLPDKQGHRLRSMWLLGPTVVRSIEEFLPR
jgi:hypothetical protein